MATVRGKQVPKGFPGDDDFEDVEDISTNFGSKFTLGDDDKAGEILSFTGQFTGTREVELENGDIGMAAEFLDLDGEKAYCWASWSLKDVIANERLTPGDYVRIVYKGEAPTKKGLNPVKQFEIKVKPGTLGK